MQEHTSQLHTVLSLLKACAKQKDLSEGTRLHADVVRFGWLEKDVSVGNTLVSMYAKCGSLEKAQEVCDKLRVRDVVSWNALIAGYAQHGYGEDALDCFERMQVDGLSPDAATFACILKACGSIRAACKGEEVHAAMAKARYGEKDVIVGTALVDMYAKCGLMAKAQEAFDKLLVRNDVSWNVLIAGYAQLRHGEQALDCYEGMQHEGLSPNAITYVCVLKACTSIGATNKGQEMHAEIVKKGLLDVNVIVGSALVDMYAKCDLLAEAQEVFDSIPCRDAVLWNTLITGCLQWGHVQLALNCFKRMKFEGLLPDATTFVCMIKACGSIGDADMAQRIYNEISREGLLEKHVVVGNALVDMYVKCGLLATAQDLFDKLPLRDIASWGTLIGGYAEHGYGEEALNCFRQMQSEGFSPNAITFVCALKACASTGNVNKGQDIHAEIIKEGLQEKDVFVGTALVVMYAKCGLIAKAEEVFDKLLVWDVVLWNALLAGYVQNEHDEEALNCFEQMQLEGFSPNRVTFICILKVCGNLGAAYKGQEIHDEINGQESLGKELAVGTAIVDMYVKCGLVEKAQEVFEKFSDRDVVLWNTLITGFALLGKPESVFFLLGKMVGEGIKPDLATFLVVLNACSHAGLLSKGLMYFEVMSTCHGVLPALEHYACMIDLLGRAGLLEKAVAIVREMPFSATPTVWHIVLGACRKWGNVKVGSKAFEHIVQMDQGDAAAYVSMSNMYVDESK